MIKSTLGAPLGGTTCGGQYGFESLASSLITPSNFVGGGGNCLPSIVMVALGEPGTPVICCAIAGPAASTTARRNASVAKIIAFLCMCFLLRTECLVTRWFPSLHS